MMKKAACLQAGRFFHHHPISSNTRCSCQHQAVAFGAGELAVGADGGVGDAELTREGCSQLRVEHLLDLLVVAVHGEAEESEKTEIGIGDVHREIAAARSWSNGGISRADVHTRPVDV